MALTQPPATSESVLTSLVLQVSMRWWMPKVFKRKLLLEINSHVSATSLSLNYFGRTPFFIFSTQCKTFEFHSISSPISVIYFLSILILIVHCFFDKVTLEPSSLEKSMVSISEIPNVYLTNFFKRLRSFPPRKYFVLQSVSWEL